jgi:hypothetical protein
MKKVIGLITLFLFLGVMVQKAFPAGQAQSTTETTVPMGELRKTTVFWKSDSTGTLANLSTSTKFRGFLVEVGIRSGTIPPNNNYGFQIKDVNGVDLLNGGFAVVDSTEERRVVPMAVTNGDTIPNYPVIDGSLFLNLSSSTKDSTNGYIDLFWIYK